MPSPSGIIAPRGVDISWREQGEGPPVLMLHGVGSALDSFDIIAASLATRYRVLRYDLRGHGDSGKPPGPYSLSDFVNDAIDLLDARGIQRAQLIGFSFGAMIAQAVAIEHPDRVDRLVLVSSVAARTAQESERMRQRASALEEGGPSNILEAALERWFTPEFRARHPEVVDKRVQRAMQNDPVGYVAAYRVFAESDIDEPLSRIQAPTLVMTGEHDVGSSPRMARLIHERVKGSQLEILAGLRHNVIAEAPELITGLVLGFFESAPGRNRSRSSAISTPPT